ncbi:MAG: DUF5989 family protein [Myxococcota bacterium]
MTENNAGADQRPDESLAEKAAQKHRGILAEYWAFLKEEKKWWLAPFLIFLLAVGAFVALGGTAAAPFIYTLF